MRRIVTVFSLILVLTLTLFPAFAAEGDETTEPQTDTVTETETEQETGSGTGTGSVNVTVDPTPVNVNVEEVVSPVSVQNISGLDNVSRTSLIQVIEALFGKYVPRTYTVTTYLSDGTSVSSVQYVDGLAGVDWEWVSGVALFTLALYCIFRMIGGIFKWK